METPPPPEEGAAPADAPQGVSGGPWTPPEASTLLLAAVGALILLLFATTLLLHHLAALRRCLGAVKDAAVDNGAAAVAAAFYGATAVHSTLRFVPLFFFLSPTLLASVYRVFTEFQQVEPVVVATPRMAHHMTSSKEDLAPFPCPALNEDEWGKRDLHSSSFAFFSQLQLVFLPSTKFSRR